MLIEKMSVARVHKIYYGKIIHAKLLTANSIDFKREKKSLGTTYTFFSIYIQK